jgi:hypothetical protein
MYVLRDKPELAKLVNMYIKEKFEPNLVRISMGITHPYKR